MVDSGYGACSLYAKPGSFFLETHQQSLQELAIVWSRRPIRLPRAHWGLNVCRKWHLCAAVAPMFWVPRLRRGSARCRPVCRRLAPTAGSREFLRPRRVIAVQLINKGRKTDTTVHVGRESNQAGAVLLKRQKIRRDGVILLCAVTSISYGAAGGTGPLCHWTDLLWVPASLPQPPSFPNRTALKIHPLLQPKPLSCQITRLFSSKTREICFCWNISDVWLKCIFIVHFIYFLWRMLVRIRQPSAKTVGLYLWCNAS